MRRCENAALARDALFPIFYGRPFLLPVVIVPEISHSFRVMSTLNTILTKRLLVLLAARSYLRFGAARLGAGNTL